MDWPTSSLIITGTLSAVAVIVAAILKKGNDKDEMLPILRELSDILKELKMWFKDTRDNTTITKECANHIKEKVDSDHDTLNELKLWMRDTNIEMSNMGKANEALHKRHDKIYALVEKRTETIIAKIESIIKT